MNKKPAPKRKRNQIGIRLSDGEHRALHRIARVRGVSISDLFRQLMQANYPEAFSDANHN